MQLSPHFALSEFASPVYRFKTGKERETWKLPPPKSFRPNLRRLCKALELIRVAAGDTSLTVVSGWRSVEFNRRNKGRATRSQHLEGRAADLQLGGRGSLVARQKRLYFAILDLQRAGEIPKGGLAYYPGRYSKKLKRIVGTFVHYDIRGRNARWKAAPKRP